MKFYGEQEEMIEQAPTVFSRFEQNDLCFIFILNNKEWFRIIFWEDKQITFDKFYIDDDDDIFLQSIIWEQGAFVKSNFKKLFNRLFKG